MSLLVGLLLLCLSWTPTCSELIDSNDLVDDLFSISRQDSARMQRLMEIYTSNGVLDRAKYDEELERTQPRLHITMTAFRKVYREIDEADKSASHFIDVLLLTARQARDQEISREHESKKILDNFNALPQSTKDYLITKFPLLKYLKYSDSSSTEKPPRGLETSTPSQPSTTKTLGTSTPSQPSVTKTLETSASSKPSTTKVSTTSSTMATTTTSPHLPNAEIKKGLERAVKKLKGLRRGFPDPYSSLSPALTAFESAINKLPLWDPESFKNIFNKSKEFAHDLLHWCNIVKSDCGEVSEALASTLKELLNAAVVVDPTNSKMKALSSAFSTKISDPALNWDQLLRIVTGFAESVKF